MDHRYTSKYYEPPGRYAPQSAQHPLLEWLQNPTVLIVAAGILFTAFYQSLHSSPFHRHRHPGELLWDLIITITPAALLYAIDDWLKTLKGDTRKHATSFISRVNSVAGTDNQRRHLLGSAVIAFERLRRRDRLSEIQATDDANLPALVEAFKSIDDVEAAMYYDIVQQRLDIIGKFEGLTDGGVLESVNGAAPRIQARRTSCDTSWHR